ncbi:AMP-binding enzyme [Pseudonocardia nigra]|uniref:AMP-binding enzyme n=1 Tax=Pseudonocardia nigra TaxID=1921578 RepID=UPI0035561E92
MPARRPRPARAAPAAAGAGAPRVPRQARSHRRRVRRPVVPHRRRRPAGGRRHLLLPGPADRIRVRGENLSSSQVEDVLHDHPDVGLAAAFAVSGAEGDENDIVVYVQPEDGRTIDPEDVSRWCAQHMPKFMRPRHIRVVDEIPRTPTNKIEKYRLRQDFRGDRTHRS